jgi:hypothetical protein
MIKHVEWGCSMTDVADSNWLLSSVAQSAAALVAIVGGFLVSRLVVMQAERVGLEGRLLEEERELGRRRELLCERDNLLKARAFDDALTSVLPAIANLMGGTPDESVIREAARDSDLSVAEVGTYLSEASASLKRFLDWLRELDASSEPWPANFDEARRMFTVDRRFEQLMSKGFRAADRQREQRLREEEERRQGQSLQSMAKLFGSSPFMSSLLSPAGIGYTPGFNPDLLSGLNPRPNWIPSREQLDQDVMQSEARVATVKDRLALVQAPPGLRAGFGVLLLFAVSGILYPVAVMALVNRAYLGAGWRLSVLLAFTVGLVSVLSYMGWLVRQTTRRRLYEAKRHD